MLPKSKIVSFRLSSEEYARIREAADAIGMPNLSLLARAALQRVLDGQDGGGFALSEQVRGLRSKLADISTELDRLSRLVDEHSAAAASNGHG